MYEEIKICAVIGHYLTLSGKTRPLELWCVLQLHVLISIDNFEIEFLLSLLWYLCIVCTVLCFGAHQIVVESSTMCCISVVWVIPKNHSAFRTTGTDLPVAHFRIPEDLNPHLYRYEKIKSCIVICGYAFGHILYWHSSHSDTVPYFEYLIFIEPKIKMLEAEHSLSLQRLYSPGWASASFKSFLHPSQFRATIFQFLHPSLATSSSTPSSQRSLALPLGCFPPGSLRRTLLDKSSSSWRMTCPAHLSLISSAEFHNVFLTT